MPKEPSVTVQVILTPNTPPLTVNGQVARIIAYLARHSSFFNDPETLGTVTFSTKDGSAVLREDVRVGN